VAAGLLDDVLERDRDRADARRVDQLGDVDRLGVVDERAPVDDLVDVMWRVRVSAFSATRMSTGRT